MFKRIVIAFCLPFNFLLAQPVEPDPTFGVEGSVIATPFTSVYYDIALQPDGKVITGNIIRISDTSVAVFTRYKTNGMVDSSFGINGSSMMKLPGIADIHIYSITVLPGGEILAGAYFVEDPYASGYFLFKYTSSGYLDSSFSNDGIVVYHFATGTEGNLNNIVVQPDGKILVCAAILSDCKGYFVSRHTAYGVLDSSFAINGVYNIPFDFSCQNISTGLALRTDGKLIVCGTINTFTDNDGAMATIRLTANGKPDSTFSGDGISVIDANPGYADLIWRIAIQPDNKVLAGGFLSNQNMAGSEKAYLLRMNEDGTLDTGFGFEGIAFLSTILPGNSAYTDIMIDSFDRLICTGYRKTGENYVAILVRLLPDGRPDPGFGTNGIITNTPLGINGISYSVKRFQNRLYIAGSTSSFPFITAYREINSTVPVVLQFFKAAEQTSGIKLNWKVSVKDNIKGYVVEKSYDGVRFFSAGFVLAGASDEYDFLDPGRSSLPRFYRLKLEYINETKTYSPVIFFKGQVHYADLQVYPNPATEVLHVPLSQLNGKPGKFVIINATGAIITSREKTNINNNLVSLDLHKLKPGIYYLLYYTADEMYKAKFVKL